MIIAIDIGNSNTVVGFFEGDSLVNSSRFATDNTITIDELTIKFANILNFYNIDKNNIEAVIIANVVPSLNIAYKGLVDSLFQCKCYFIKDYIDQLPIKTNYNNLYELGDDRIANAVIGYNNYDTDMIIIDFGTAITFDIITRKEGYIGGIILAGVNLAIEYLSQQTAKLPEVEFEKTIKVVGKNTVHAIESGLFYGYLAMIEGLIPKIIAESDMANAKVVTTGGMGKIFAENSQMIDCYDSNLTLDGLIILYNHIIKL